VPLSMFWFPRAVIPTIYEKNENLIFVDDVPINITTTNRIIFQRVDTTQIHRPRCANPIVQKHWTKYPAFWYENTISIFYVILMWFKNSYLNSNLHVFTTMKNKTVYVAIQNSFKINKLFFAWSRQLRIHARH